MTRPLEGVKVIEVATWAFVPVAGAILSELGATVIKIEPPSGDPIRSLFTGLGTALTDINLSFEAYNRGKRSITLDLRQGAGYEVLLKLLADADVFLTNLLPPARRAMRIDAASLRTRFPRLIYASGSALGQAGPDADKGGYDAITFWARGGVSSSVTADEAEVPAGPPGPAFGDTIGGSMLAGGICAAIARRELHGVGSEVDVSLLAAAMWAMQRAISQATLQGVLRFARPAKDRPNNVLVNTYRTSDGRFVALCMLQSDKYWARFCALAGRPELGADPRYLDAAARRQNLDACVSELKALFASKTLEEWCAILGQQSGQWDVVRHVGELHADVQALANGYVQTVDAGDGRRYPSISVPMQFDGAPYPAQPAPLLGADTEALLTALGYDEQAILDLKVAGVVF